VLPALGGVIGSWRFAPGDGVPPAVGPFAHATAAGETLYVTGQMPTDLDGRLVEGGIAAQTDQVMRNVSRVLELAGGALDDVIQVRAYLLEFDDDYVEFNAAYERWFPSRLPSRTCVGVSGLAVAARVEVDAVAWRADGWGRRVSEASNARG
jgi:reactive intermediate/imine deaminase